MFQNNSKCFSNHFCPPNLISIFNLIPLSNQRFSLLIIILFPKPNKERKKFNFCPEYLLGNEQQKRI